MKYLFTFVFFSYLLLKPVYSGDYAEDSPVEYCSIIASEDATVFNDQADGSVADSNFGSGTMLYVKPSNTGFVNKRSFFKFEQLICTETGQPIPSNALINKAVLRLFINGNHIQTTHQLQKVSAGHSWNESSITWNNQATVNAEMLDSTGTSTNLDPLTVWDLTPDFIAIHQGNSENNGWRVSAVPTDSVLNHAYFSKEHSNTLAHPRLRIAYQLPQTDVLPPDSTPQLWQNPTLDYPFRGDCDGGLDMSKMNAYRIRYGNQVVLLSKEMQPDISMHALSQFILYLEHLDRQLQKIMGVEGYYEPNKLKGIPSYATFSCPIGHGGFDGTGMAVGGTHLMRAHGQDAQKAKQDMVAVAAHEMLHRFLNGSQYAYMQSPDVGHAALNALEPILLAQFDTGFHVYQANNTAMPLEIYAFNSYWAGWERYLNTPSLTWADYYGDAEYERFNNNIKSGQNWVEAKGKAPDFNEVQMIQASIVQWIERSHGIVGLRAFYQQMAQYNYNLLAERGEGEAKKSRIFYALANGLQVNPVPYFNYWKFPVSAEMQSYIVTKGYNNTSILTGIDAFTDNDGDGFNELAGDFDDSNSTVYPKAPELMDGIDNNLDGQIDETFFYDEITDMSPHQSNTQASLPLLIHGSIPTTGNVGDEDSLTFTLTEGAFVSFMIRSVDGHQTTEKNGIELNTFMGSLYIDRQVVLNVAVDNKAIAQTTKYYRAGQHTLRVRGLAVGDYLATGGRYVVQAYINKHKPKDIDSDPLALTPYKSTYFTAGEANPDFSCESQRGASNAECLGVLSIYNTFDGENWVDDRGWLVGDNVCDWAGVNCDANGVSDLVFSNSQRFLKGNIRSIDWSGLSHVRVLKFGLSKYLYGALPSEFSSMQLEQMSFNTSPNLCVFSEDRAWFDAIAITSVTLPDCIDSDNDGVEDTFGSDLCPAGNTVDMDNDNDGCDDVLEDLDDDNDGVEDVDDAFPLDSTESVDTDGDGVGNNADTDDDNDGIADEEDASPLDPEVGDDQSPVIGNVEVLTFEATGELTHIELVAPEVTDNNANAPTITADLVGSLALGEHSITWTATDFAGNQTTKVQTIIIEDTTAPEFDELKVLTLNAKGRLTNISAESENVAFDLVDGELLTTLVGETELLSGHHDVELTAVDLSGNRANTTLPIDILPETSLSTERNVEAGGAYTQSVTLSGEASSYPVQLSYQLTLNGDVVDTLNGLINEGTQGQVTFTIPVDAVVSDNVVLTLLSATNAFVGEVNQTQLTVIENNAAPLLDGELSQNGESVSVVDPDNGLVTITATVSDVNQIDSHELTWDVEDSAFVDEAIDNNILTFEINPENLAEGTYAVVITATENNTAESLQVSQRVQFVVEELAVLDTETDSDGDGIVDSEEGYSDSDGDGIADYLDDDSNTTRLPSAENTEPMQTSPGLTMSLGSLAASQGSSSEYASLTVDDLAALVGDDAADTQDNHYETTTPLYNFTIAGLAEQGDSVAVVIPLEAGTSLPSGAGYRKYNTTNGWFAFVEDENNSVSSALADENGNCPAANDVSYSPESGLGLVEGDNCIQLVIEDGGPNDADFEVNGSIEDPGAIVTEQQNHAPVIELTSYYDVDEETQVTLDASRSTDDDGDTLTYSWVQLSGTLVELIDITNSQLTFISPSVSTDEALSFELTVDDGFDSSNQTVQVMVKQVNKAPVVSIDAHAISGQENTTLMLNAIGSDVDGDALSYQWQQLSGTDVSFDNATASQVTMTLPEVSADEVIEVQVTVNDGETSTTTITTFTVENKVEVITVTPEKNSNSGGGSMGILLLLTVLVRLRKPTFVKIAA
jgi:hypothetical protein